MSYQYVKFRGNSNQGFTFGEKKLIPTLALKKDQFSRPFDKCTIAVSKLCHQFLKCFRVMIERRYAFHYAFSSYPQNACLYCMISDL